MLILQLIANGVVAGAALGMMAISFSLFYSTTKIFHVAHAGVLTLSGYICWSLVGWGVPTVIAALVSIAVCGLIGVAIQYGLYNPLKRRRATDLVILIASLGLLAIFENGIALVYTSNLLQFPDTATGVVNLNGLVLDRVQIITLVVGFLVWGGVVAFTRRTILGKRIRAVASNPFLAEITRMRPERMFAIVLGIASALIAIPGVLLSMDLGLQPYNGVTLMLTATVAMIAGGLGSLSGAFVLAIVISVLQNLSLLVLPSVWSVGITFLIFVVFMLFRPRGLFAN